MTLTQDRTGWSSRSEDLLHNHRSHVLCDSMDTSEKTHSRGQKMTLRRLDIRTGLWVAIVLELFCLRLQVGGGPYWVVSSVTALRVLL